MNKDPAEISDNAVNIAESELQQKEPNPEEDKEQGMEQKQLEFEKKDNAIKEAETIPQNNQDEVDSSECLKENKNQNEDNEDGNLKKQPTTSEASTSQMTEDPKENKNQNEYNEDTNLKKQPTTSEASTSQMTEDPKENKNQNEDNEDANLMKEHTTSEASTSQMSEQITESEAIRLLCNTEMKKEVIEKQSEAVDSLPEITDMEIQHNSVMENENGQSQPDDEQYKIKNITGGVKRMSVEVQGGSKAKAIKTEADDHESLLLGGDNDILDDDDYSEDDDKLLDDGENLKEDENTSSSGSSRSFKAIEGEGSYSSEEDGNTDDLQPTETIPAETENPFEDEDSEVGDQKSGPQNNVPYGGSHCFALPGVFDNDNEDPAARMQSFIQPPGTNMFMQQVIKSRLPSTSSVSSDSQVATTAKGTKQQSAAMASQPSVKIEKVMESCLTRPIQFKHQQLKQFGEGTCEMLTTVEKIIGSCK